jgi:hypothetical protein
MVASRDGFITNDLIGQIFGPDPAALAKYEQVHGGKAETIQDEALRRLMLAVLKDAIESYQEYFIKPSRTNECRFRETEDWINSESGDIFSFKSLCETLGIDAGWLRKALLRWKERQLKRFKG